MKAPAGLRVGVCTHTGLVRGANEDDYLLATPNQVAGAAFLAAVADGMGGAAGGAEASRTALRALGAKLLDGDPAAAMREGFRFGSGEGTRRTIIAIVLSGLVMALTEVSAGAKRLLQAVFGLSVAVAAVSFFPGFFGFAGAAGPTMS